MGDTRNLIDGILEKQKLEILDLDFKAIKNVFIISIEKQII